MPRVVYKPKRLGGSAPSIVITHGFPAVMEQASQCRVGGRLDDAELSVDLRSRHRALQVPDNGVF
jgi:hypothetical protein